MKRTLPECPGDIALRSERRWHHAGAEDAAYGAHSPSSILDSRLWRTRVKEKGSQPAKKMVGTIPEQAKEGSWHEPFNSSSVEKSTASSILRIPTKGRPLLRNKTSMTCENTHRDGYVGRLKGFFLCKKKEIKDGLKGRLIWSMDYIYTKPNKQLFIDILISLYSFFYQQNTPKMSLNQMRLWFDLILTIVCQQSALRLAHEIRP